MAIASEGLVKRRVAIGAGLLLWLLVLAGCESEPDGASIDCNSGDTDRVSDGDAAPPDCEPGRYRCRGTVEVQRCSENGIWAFYRDCEPSKVCDQGECREAPEETPSPVSCYWNDRICQDNDVYICNDDNNGYEVYEICTKGRECSHGECVRILKDGQCRRDDDCASGTMCNTSINRCFSPCYAQGVRCPEHFVCDDDLESMTYGYCMLKTFSDTCKQDRDCEDGWYCELTLPAHYRSGVCRPVCTEDGSCINGLSCLQGRCVVDDGMGDCNGCPDAYVCQPTFDQCVLNCPECGECESCDAESAPNCYLSSYTNPPACQALGPWCGFGFFCSSQVVGEGLGFCI